MCCRTNCSLMSSLINLPIYKRTRAKSVGMTPCQRLFGSYCFVSVNAGKSHGAKLFHWYVLTLSGEYGNYFIGLSKSLEISLWETTRGFESLSLRQQKTTKFDRILSFFEWCLPCRANDVTYGNDVCFAHDVPAGMGGKHRIIAEWNGATSFRSVATKHHQPQSGGIISPQVQHHPPICQKYLFRSPITNEKCRKAFFVW